MQYYYNIDNPRDDSRWAMPTLGFLSFNSPLNDSFWLLVRQSYLSSSVGNVSSEFIGI